MLRFGQSGARLDDLEFIALSHLHVDHAADVPALVKSGCFSSRTARLCVAGPGAGGKFSGLAEWLDARFTAQSGTFRYLSGAFDGPDGQLQLASDHLCVGVPAAMPRDESN
jgi:ribonuclease BN (tRNA processing enzyme)